MLLDPSAYESQGVGANLQLAEVADFNSLISMSQEHQTPVFALTQNQMDAVGVVLEGYETSRDHFHAEFQALADKVTGLIGVDESEG
jgi:hypothetical protein